MSARNSKRGVGVGLATWFKGRERALQARYRSDLSSPENRRRAWIHHLFLDHAILRIWWTNQARVAPGVWRSNHPLPGRVARIAALGVRDILSLRGTVTSPSYLLEKEACDAAGIRLHTISLSARNAPARAELLAMIDHFRTLPHPFLFHCKSGADRAGLAAAIYLLDQGGTMAQARAQLSPRFLHFRASKTGIMDHVLDLYARRLTRGPIGIRDWIATEYDPAAATVSYRAGALTRSST